ncbi:MAG: hypothetical protein J7463_08860 [Roseiflexus sp.]|nr:hypothetical protein [Roseiflexus sp.]MBO9384759.1 hypothetical protein [Roseiflexus sp.]
MSHSVSPDAHRLVADAIAAIRLGDKARGQKLLTQALRTNPITKSPGCGWRRSSKLPSGGVNAWNARWRSTRTTKPRGVHSGRCLTRSRCT